MADPREGTTMPRPDGIAPEPPPIERKTGVPLPEYRGPSGMTSGIATPTLADRLRPETLDELKRRGGG